MRGDDDGKTEVEWHQVCLALTWMLALYKTPHVVAKRSAKRSVKRSVKRNGDEGPSFLAPFLYSDRREV